MKKNKILVGSVLALGAFALIAPAFSNVNKTSIKAHAGVSVDVDEEDFTIDSLQKDASTLLYFDLPENDLTCYGEDSQYRFKASVEDAVVIHVDKNGIETPHAANVCYQTAGSNRYYVEFSDWLEDSFTVERGESLKLNGTVARANGDTITFNNLHIDHANGFWAMHGDYDIEERTYSALDLKATSTSTWKDGGTYYFLDITIPEEDNFPIKSAWDAYYEAENAASLVHAAGGDPIVKNALILKRSANTYTLYWLNCSWSTQVSSRTWYDFEEGDQITINGTWLAPSGSKIYSTTLKEMTFTFTNDKFELYRGGLISKAKELLKQVVDNPTYDADYVKMLDELVPLIKAFSAKEIEEFDYDLCMKALKQGRKSDLLKAEKAGKTVHESVITKDSVNATGVMSQYDTGAQFKHNAIEWYYEESTEYSSRDWNNNFRGYKDSYFENTKGVKTMIDSAIVICKGSSADEYQACFIFVSWAKPTSTAYAVSAGDRYIVNPTGYTLEKGDDFYLVEFEGADLTWTGGYWLNTSTVPNYVTLINAIDDIGVVEDSEECKARIDYAKSVLENMSSDERKWVHSSVTDKLNKADAAYSDIIYGKLAQAAVDKIDAIGVVDTSDACLLRIQEARDAIDNLNVAALVKVPKAKIAELEAAEALYKDLKAAEIIKSAVDLIHKIGVVDTSAECKARIDAAREYFDSLPDYVQAKISEEDYLILFNAEEKYKELTAKDDFKEIVNSLNDSMSASELYSAILLAKQAYERIPDKDSVATEYNKLLTYIDKYNDKISAVNDAHEEANTAAFALIGLAALMPAAIYGLLAVLKKGAF